MVSTGNRILVSLKQLIYSLFFLITILHGSTDREQYEEILVSASLIPISLNDSANSITLITADDIDNLAIANLSDLLRDLAGFSVSRSGVLGAQTQIRVRGSEANHILVLIDGIEANNSAQNDEFNWGNISASDIERIEVIRGPQSSIYGSDAMSGIINIITKTSKEKNEVQAFTEYGSFNTTNNGLSIGVKNKKFNARFGISELSTEGENISREGTENDGYEISSMNIKAEWAPSKNLNIILSGHKRFGMNEYDSDIDFDQLVDDQNNHAKFNSSTTGVRMNYINHKIKNLKHSLFLTKSENKNEDYNDYIIQNVTTSLKDQINFLSSYFWENSSQRSSLLLEHEKEEFTQNGIIYDYGIYGIFDPNQQRKKSSSSLAIEHRGNINENISYAASARHDENSQFKDGNTSRFELAYAFTNNYRIRSAYGSAIKNPTFTERFGYYTNFIGNPNLQPEKSKNFELGVDFKLNKNYLFSATFFKSKLINEINGNTIDANTSGYTAKNIDGLSKRQGIELSSAIPLNENLRINTSYTYVDSIQFEDNRYVDEVRRPKSTASTTIQWKSNKNSLFNLNVRYTDKQIDVVYPGYVMMPSYTVLNFGAKFSLNQRISIKISLNNLLNEDYEEVYGYSTLGFSTNIGIRYKF